MKKTLFSLPVMLPRNPFCINSSDKDRNRQDNRRNRSPVYGVFMEPIGISGGRMGLPDSVRFNTLYGTLQGIAGSICIR